jgi:molecular chaperone HtpG
LADPIEIPKSFTHILEKDPALYAAVLITLKSFQPWIRNSGTPFFPAYTDHSERHISEVLATASSIITDDARALLTPSDIAVLVLATLLHDIALHTTQDGFRALVRGKYQPRVYAHFGDRDWPILWSEFLAEASRFDGRQLIRIFGDARPIDPRGLDIDDLSERDNLLIGEFLRRHHARLAHQIATAGVPGPGPERLGLSTEFDEYMRDLAGLVARSHNFPIRDSFEFLNSYDRREFKGIRPVFLMAILRIADYFQVHAERADRDLLKVKQIRSPISKREWTIHHAVRDVRATHDDPEAIFIDALPNDVQTFARLRWLISDIQRELDQSWAVLGEVYGRIQSLNRLGLAIRRVRSTLDDLQGFASKVHYIPTHAAFEASGPDLLRLLVGPLYSDNPTVGVRELMQNAIDACRELVARHRGFEGFRQRLLLPGPEGTLARASCGRHRR